MLSIFGGDMEDQNDVTLVSQLDFSNPLYLHASDTASSPLINIKLKGTENYNVWSRSMLLALGTKNKLGFIDGTCEKSLTNDVLGRQWDRCNSVVLSWILGSISEELYAGQIFNTNANIVWTELETYNKVDGSIMFNLHHQINSLKQNGSPISDYYHKLNSLWKQYDALIQLPNCVCDAANGFQSHNKALKLMQFLMGLDDMYMFVRSNILIREPIPDVKTAYAIISREESHRGASVNESVTKGQNSVFVSQVNNNKRMFNKNFNRGPNPNFKCTHCDMIGHTVDRCFDLVGYPSDYKGMFGTRE